MTKVLLAGCVLLDDYGRLLLLHRSSDEQSHWELPGGKIEDGEAAEQAAVREVREELGVEAEVVKFLGDCSFEIDGREYQFSWFLGKITTDEPRICEPEMFDDLEYFEVADLMSLALSPNMHELFAKIINREISLSDDSIQ